jgi:hypothetical protein
MLRISFQDGTRAGEVVEFADEVDRIVIGRDPVRCRVVFPPEETRVGRQHCALVQELGRYRIEVNRDDVVQLDGHRVVFGTELPPDCQLRLGEQGPLVAVRTRLSGDFLPTIDTDPQEGMDAAVVKIGRKGRRTRGLAMAAVAGLIVVASVTAWNSRTIVGLSARTVALGQLSEEERASVENLSDRLKNIDERLKARQPQLVQRLKQAARSVYLVLERDEVGVLRRKGTCWVIDSAGGWLATNAHVAEECDPKSLARGWQAVVRSPGPESRTFVVDRVMLHPGYALFERLWKEYEPLEQTDATGHAVAVYSAQGCDVALLHVAQPQGLAPSLAPIDAATALEPGEPVGYVGYPMEGVSMHGTLVDTPVPIEHLGYIVRVTDYFGTTDGGTEPALVAHSLPTAGGASGSPILDREGRVVAIHSNGNALGTLVTADGPVRIDSTAMVNYAQRADLLVELLGGTAPAKMPARLNQWQATLTRHFRKRRTVERALLVKNLVSDVFLRELAPTFEWRAQTEPVPDLTDVALDAVPAAPLPTWQRIVRLDSPGRYLLSAASDHVRSLRLAVVEPTRAEGSREYRGTPYEDVLQYVEVDVASPTTLRITVTAPSGAEPSGGGEAHLFVVRGAQMRLSVDELHAALVQRWLNRFSTPKKPYRPGRPTVQPGSLPALSRDGTAPVKYFESAAVPAGLYLVTVVTKNGAKIGLSADQGSGRPQENDGSCLSANFALESPGKISGLLTSRQSEPTDYELRLYAFDKAPP